MSYAFDPEIARYHHERGARGAFFAMALQAISGWPVATVEMWCDDEIDAPKRPYRPVRFINTDAKGRALDVTGVHEGATFLAGPALRSVRAKAFVPSENGPGAQRIMLGVRFFGTALIVGADPVFKQAFGKYEVNRVESAKRQIRANKAFVADIGQRKGLGAKDVHLPYYTHGAAYAYALALARTALPGTDPLPLVSIEGTHAPSGQAWLHAGLKANADPQDHRLIDAWGVVSVADVVRRYSLTDVRVDEETYEQVLARFPDAASSARFTDYIAEEARQMQDARPQVFAEHDGKKGFMQPLGGAFWRVAFERSLPNTPVFEIGAPQRQAAIMSQLLGGANGHPPTDALPVPDSKA